MSSNSSGKKLEGFLTGKGFYIVLFLCAAVIGVSAWMMAAGNKTMTKDITEQNKVSLENKRVETVIIPPQEKAEPVQDSLDEPVEAEAPQVNTEGIAEPVNENAEESGEVWREGDVMEVAAPLYIWPVSGDLERQHNMEALSYDVTMRDWRTHEGIDILAPLGTPVTAAHAGTVESVEDDDLYGKTVTVDHGDGSKTVYSNLAAETAVSVGAWVEPGDTIGSVGETALGEIGQGEHLHFAVSVNGESVNPLNYLPA